MPLRTVLPGSPSILIYPFTHLFWFWHIWSKQFYCLLIKIQFLNHFILDVLCWKSYISNMICCIRLDYNFRQSYHGSISWNQRITYCFRYIGCYLIRILVSTGEGFEYLWSGIHQSFPIIAEVDQWGWGDHKTKFQAQTHCRS